MITRRLRIIGIKDRLEFSLINEIIAARSPINPIIKLNDSENTVNANTNRVDSENHIKKNQPNIITKEETAHIAEIIK
jgi:hypothetical protein